MSYFQIFNFQELVIISTKVDLDIDSVDESDEEANNFVCALGDNLTPIHLRQIEPVSAGGKYKLIFTSSKIAIWENSNKTGPVASNSTEFDADVQTTLYVEGLQKSDDFDEEEISITWFNNTATCDDADRVRFTVIDGEFDVVLRIFIPRHPTGRDYVEIPIAGIAFGGDDRTFSTNRFGPSFRSLQESRAVPYDFVLDQTNGIKNGSALNENGISRSYDKATSVDPITDRLTDSAKADTIPGVPEMIAEDLATTADMNILGLRLDDKRVQIKYFGFSTMPLLPAFLTPDIDWDFCIEIDGSDFLHPKYKLTGSHDGFPGYEIYVYSAGGVTTVYQYDPWANGFTPDTGLPAPKNIFVPSGTEGNIQ